MMCFALTPLLMRISKKNRINPRNREFDVIFVNGDNNIENLRLEDENWKVIMTEREFNTRMWEEA